MALRPTASEQHVMDVLAVALKNRSSADETADHRHAGVYDRKRKCQNGSHYGHRGGRFLRSQDGEGSKGKSDKERA